MSGRRRQWRSSPMEGEIPWTLRAAEVGTFATLAASALALGGAHVRVVLVSVFVVACCGVLGLAAGSLRSVPKPALVLAALGGYTLVQSVPLPMSWLTRLSPAAADIWSRSLSPLAEPVRFGSLSLDPGASSVEAAKWFAYAVAFCVAAAFGRRRGANGVLALVFLSALSVAVATLGHGLLGATSVFGVYDPQLGTSSAHVGPMLNPNCLAGYLLLGVFSGLGFTLAATRSAWRWIWAAGTAVLTSAAVLAGSRGGFVALLVGMAGLALFTYRAQNKRVRVLKWYDWTAVGTALAVAVAFSLLGVQDDWFQLRDKDITKLQMGTWVLPLLRDFPVFGVGRGAFESAFQSYKPTADNLIYANPENIFAQWFSEWGVAVAALAFVLLAWLLRPSRIGFGRHLSASGALIGVGALLLQNCVDFSLELFAPMLAVVLILGACWGQAQGSQGEYSEQPSSALRSARGLSLVVGLLLVTVLAVARGRSPVAMERLALQSDYQRLSETGPTGVRSLWAKVRLGIQRHPAESYFPRLGAVLALREGNVEPMPWIARALELCEVDSRTHWLLANVLIRHNLLQQALLEARLSVEYDVGFAAGVGAAAARWSQRVEDIERAAPRGPAGSQVRLSAALNLDPKKYAAERELLIRSAIRHDPGLAAAHRALAEELLRELGGARCAGELHAGCGAALREAADTLDRLEPRSANGSQVRARLFAATRQLDQAERVFAKRCPELQGQERAKCWQALLSLALGLSDRAAVVRAADHFVKAACIADQDCTHALTHAGDVMVGVGAWLEALAYFERAAHRTPTAGALLKVADAASALSQFATAGRALTQAASYARSDPAMSREIDLKRQALLFRSVTR